MSLSTWWRLNYFNDVNSWKLFCSLSHFLPLSYCKGRKGRGSRSLSIRREGEFTAPQLHHHYTITTVHHHYNITTSQLHLHLNRPWLHVTSDLINSVQIHRRKTITTALEHNVSYRYISSLCLGDAGSWGQNQAQRFSGHGKLAITVNFAQAFTQATTC